jgi:dihydroflavonol-4-reductase
MNLVTGANGFVGAAVVRAILHRGEAARALVREGSNLENLRGLDIELVRGDITNADSLRRACRGCSTVFHVAADYRLWAPDPELMFATNVGGSVNVVESAAHESVERLVYTSSVAVLGINADRSPADESTPVTVDDMIGPYKRSKFEAEVAVLQKAQLVEMPTVVVNPSTPIGPGDIKPTPTGRIVIEAATGRMPAYVDTGLNVVHVDDVAEGHLLARDKGRPGERYVLGGTDLELREILELVAAACGTAPPRIRLPRAAIYPVAWVSELLARFSGHEPRVTLDGLRMSAKHMYFSSAKAHDELGYTWRAPDFAIRDALEWFRDHGYLG